jgi:hypothetical protein
MIVPARRSVSLASMSRRWVSAIRLVVPHSGPSD